MFLIFDPTCPVCETHYKAEADGSASAAGEYRVRCPRCFTDAVVAAETGRRTDVSMPWAVRATAT